MENKVYEQFYISNLLQEEQWLCDVAENGTLQFTIFLPFRWQK